MQITKNQLSSYSLKKTLGRGTFGKVKLAIHQKTGQPVAIKILEKNKIKDVTDVERVSRELHILKITQHASVAQMYEIIENQSTIFIVMQFAPYGEFFDYIMDGKIKDEIEAHHYFVQIVRVLQYLHELKISHRDVKPQNMLLDHENRLKIVDFGLSNMYKKGQQLLTACGSPCYASPQMIKGQPYDPELTDVWSLGVVLFSMVMAKLPFQDDNTSVLYGKIKSGLYIIDRKISVQLKDLISKLLSVNPSKRYHLEQIKKHPWYRQKQVIKLSGIKIGFQTAPLDVDLLQQMRDYGYNIEKVKKYLQNNIRNDQTAAYYLLMKKKFREGKQSLCDINNQSFDQKRIIPKMSLVAKPKKKIQNRHKSFDFSLSMKQLERFDDKSTGRYSVNQQNANKEIKKVRKQRLFHSQQKSYDFDKGFPIRNSIKSKNGYFTSLSRSNKKNSLTKYRNQSPLRIKNSQKSFKGILKKSSSKNLQKQHNISINVYINNAKIQTPSHTRTKKKSKKDLNIQKQIISLANGSIYKTGQKIFNKRLKTQAIDRQLQRERSMNRKDSSFRQTKKKNVNDNQTNHFHNKSLQKSHQISLMDNGTFWKKRSTHKRENTTETRGNKSRNRYH